MPPQRQAAEIPAAAYIRVSLAREEMISPELQRASIERRIAIDGADIPPDRWIEELDISGRGFGRKGVKQVIGWVRDSVVQRVYVYKYSRFGRNPTLVAVNVELMEDVGGELISTTEDIDASTAVGRFTRGMLWQVDGLQSDIIGENWQEAHARRLARGLPHSGARRFGYLYHGSPVTGPCPLGCAPGECETGYEPDPATASYGGGMFDDYNGGASVLTIAVGLNARGLYTTAGKPWVQRSVRKYMDSGFAAGFLWVHDPECEHKTTKAAQECRKLKVHVPGAHEPILTGETREEQMAVWEEYLRNRARRRKLPPRVENPVYPLSGLMQCGRCHGPMNSTFQTRHLKRTGETTRYYLYSCANWRRNRSCPGSWVSRRRLEQTIRAWLAGFEEEIAALQGAERAQKRVADTAALDRKRLAREAGKIEGTLTELTVKVAAGVIEDDAYVLARDQLKARRTEIGARLDALAGQQTRLARPARQEALRLSRDWDDLSPEDLNRALARLVDHVEAVQVKFRQVRVSIASAWNEVYVYDIR